MLLHPIKMENYMYVEYLSGWLPYVCLSRNKIGSEVKKERCLQDLNLRGETPLDFKSNALTTRPKQLAYH